MPSSARITPNTIVIPNCGLAGGGTPLNPGLCPALNPNVLANGSLPEQKRDFSQLQPKVSLTWKATPNWTLYGNWGIGFKSGGFNNQGSSKTVDVFINCVVIPNNCGPTGSGTPAQRSVFVRDFFDKEKSSAAEIGFKSFLVDHRLQFDFSVFDTTVDNMQNFEFLVGGFGLLRVVNNIDKVKLKGAEIGFNFRVNEDLRLIAGYSRVESEITANKTRPQTVGNQSPYTPSYTGTLGVELGVPVSGNGWRVDGSAFLNLVGPTWFHVVQAQQNPTLFGAPGDFTLSRRDRFSTVDARLGMSNDHWNMAIVGKNVANKKYLQEVIPAAEFGGAFIHPGAERRFSLEVGYKF